jgi:hypothetical protein
LPSLVGETFLVMSVLALALAPHLLLVLPILKLD